MRSLSTLSCSLACVWLAMSACAAHAQTQPSSPSALTSSMPTAATATSGAKKTPTTAPLDPNVVYRWTDAQGQVQYSQRVPEDRKHTARALDGKKMNTVQAYRPPPSLNAEPNREGRPAPGGKPSNSAAGSPADGSCEAAWQAYNESQACIKEGRMAVRTAKGSRSAPDSSCPEVPRPQAPC